MELVLKLMPGQADRLLATSDGQLQLNVAAFLGLTKEKRQKALGLSFERANQIAAEGHRELVLCGDFRPFVTDFRRVIDDPEFDDPVIDNMLTVIAGYQSRVKLAKQAGAKESSKSIKHHLEDDYPEYEVGKHAALVRYGVVELRVVQNYLLDRESLRLALQDIIRKLDDEKRMYEPGSPTNYLVADDPDFNLRTLMTNAGFYVQPDIASAWRALECWAEGYISALRSSYLAWHNGFAPYYLKIQRAIRRQYSVVPQYVRSPNPFKIYDSLRDKKVLFLSALAHLAQDQVTSGRIHKLYKHRDVPGFSLRGIQAWISTWPNRPHADWYETFQRTCEMIEMEYRREPFDIFVAACGCYGLPVCDFVRKRFGCAVLYVGHFSNVIFGIRPGRDPDYMKERVNREMWVSSDLQRFPNMARIDGGRYV